MREMVGGCCVCSDDRGWSENPLVYCDGQSCTVAVHQACYGIVTVPTGPWYCRKCESQERAVKVKCELCPSKYGALKRTDNSGWAHVVCALYIPEVRFGNVTTMEPIQLQLIPPERFNKTCYICEEKGKASSASVGACMQCNKTGCKQQFHVTCAQGLGLLCEEAGNYLDNVKYCGYCQYHYSKLKKGGNVKTIPPYKPVATENLHSDSSSEKEAEAGKSATSPSSGKRSKSSSSKSATSSSKTSNTSSSSSSSSKSTSAQAKSTPSSGKAQEKPKLASSSGKSAKEEGESVGEKRDSKAEVANESESKGEKDSKAKKRKANSRTPTPVGVISGEVGAIVSAVTSANTASSASTTTASSDKKSSSSDNDKKKFKVDTTQSILINQPVVALTSISTIKATSPATTAADTAASETAHSALPTQTVVQTAQTHIVNSLLVSVPLSSTSISPHNNAIFNNQGLLHPPERTGSTGSAERSTPVGVIAGTSNSGTSNMLSSEISSGGFKIAYEKQDSINTEVDMELEVPAVVEELPAKRGRSQSNEKEGRGRGKKKSSGANGVPGSQLGSLSGSKRTSRSQHPTPPPQGAFSSISQIKDSPPSSPGSESQGASSSSRGRARGRKSAPASVNAGSSKDSKDIKLFQNGVSAPHMLGNQLNPNSNMAQKMTDHLNSELEAHSIFTPGDNSNLIGPQLHQRVVSSVSGLETRANSTGGSSTTSGGSGLSSMLGGNGGNIPQTLDQLLERQWEQGSQFLMEQAQHFDIASLLSCLHQLRAENLRLEEHVSSLLQRRDHLLAVNARLAIPLTGQPAATQAPHPHTINNIHPAVGGHGEGRPARHSSGNGAYQPHQQGGQHSGGPVENGLPPEQYPHSHRSPAGSQQSPSVRQSPSGQGFASNGLLRHNSEASGRSAPRPQSYSLYQGLGPSQQQMVMRRDAEGHHQNSSKPS